MDFDQDIINDFLDESKDHIQTIEQNLLDVEAQGGQFAAETIDRVFRSIHSIKGTSSFMGLTTINQLAHTMENLLQLIRSGKIQPDSSHISALLEGVDQLTLLLSNVNTANATDIQPINNHLAHLIAKDESSTPHSALTIQIPLTGQEGESDTFVISDVTLNSLPSTHEFIYLLRFDFDQFTAEGGFPGAMVRTLLGTGMILEFKLEPGGAPSEETQEVEHLRLSILYSTMMTLDLVQHITRLEECDIVQTRTADLQQSAQQPSATQLSAPSRKPTPDLGPNPSQPATSGPSSATNSSQTVRIGVEILDRLMTLTGELVLIRNQILSTANAIFQDRTVRPVFRQLDILTSDLEETIMLTRLFPIAGIFSKLPRVVRDLASKLGKTITIATEGDEIELDKLIIEGLTDPLTHLIRNCCDHTDATRRAIPPDSSLGIRPCAPRSPTASSFNRTSLRIIESLSRVCSRSG